jgi:uracil-DNA glycosylase
VGKLAIGRFLEPVPLQDIVGRTFRVKIAGLEADCIPLPHPSGASPWHRMEPGKTLLGRALALIAAHPETKVVP